MKKFLLLLGWLLLFNCLCSSSSGQTTSSSARELVLAVDQVTDKNVEAIKTTLTHTAGITTYGYCAALKCFLMTYDPAVFESPETVAAMLETAYPSCKAQIKIGASINQLIDNCTRYPLPTIGTAR